MVRTTLTNKPLYPKKNWLLRLHQKHPKLSGDLTEKDCKEVFGLTKRRLMNKKNEDPLNYTNLNDSLDINTELDFEDVLFLYETFDIDLDDVYQIYLFG